MSRGEGRGARGEGWWSVGIYFFYVIPCFLAMKPTCTSGVVVAQPCAGHIIKLNF